MEIRNAAHLRQLLANRHGLYDGPYYVQMADGGVLCMECAHRERGLLAAALSAVRKDASAAASSEIRQWLPLAVESDPDVPEMRCDHCYEVIYAEE